MGSSSSSSSSGSGDDIGLTTTEMIIFLVWSTGIMLFLAWTVTPSRAGTGRSEKRRASSTITSPTGGSPRTTDKRAKEAQQQSLFFAPGSATITSSSSSTGGDSDRGIVPSKLPETNKLQQHQPQQQQQQNIRANMSIPLRGRSQSSYSTFDISATVTRRKGSADDIVEPILRPQRDLGSPVLSPDSTGPADPSQRANMNEGAHVMDPREVVKKGRLFKLSISKKLAGDKTPVWKQRDFVLSGYYLSYLDSMKRRNEFDLRGCTVTSLIVHKGPGLSMDLHAITINTANNSRHIVLGGSSEEHRDEWVRCLEAQLTRIARLEEESGGEVEEARYKGIPSPLEQMLLNPALPSMGNIGNRLRLASGSAVAPSASAAGSGAKGKP